MLAWTLLLDASAATLSVPSLDHPTLASAVEAAVAGDVIEVGVLGSITSEPVVIAKSIDVIGVGSSAAHVPPLIVEGAVTVRLENLSPKALTSMPEIVDADVSSVMVTCAEIASDVNGDTSTTTDLAAPPALCVIGATVDVYRLALTTYGYGIVSAGATVTVDGLTSSGRGLPAVLGSGWNGVPGSIRLVNPDLQKQTNRAIEVEGTSLVIEGGKLAGNGYKLDGSDIVALDADVTVDGTSFYARTYDAYDWGPSVGGAIKAQGGSLTVRNAWFWSYKAGAGGAIYANDAAVRVEDSVFSGNAASGGGGAMVTAGAEVIVKRSRFCDNWASGTMGGGALLLSPGAGVLTEVRESVFVGNSAGQGAAIATPAKVEATASRVAVWNNTFYGNAGEYDGSAAVAVGAETVEFVNNLVVGTQAGFGLYGGTTVWNDFDLYFETLTPVVQLGTRAVGTGANDLVGVDPLLVAPGGCDGDYDLLPDSPAIDAGDGVDSDGSAADIGAFGGHAIPVDTGIVDTDGIDTDLVDTDAVDTDLPDTDATDSGLDPVSWIAGGGGCATMPAGPPVGLLGALVLLARRRRS